MNSARRSSPYGLLAGGPALLADLSSGAACGDPQAVAHGFTRRRGFGDRAGEQRSGQVVVAIGNGGGDLIARRPVELGRPSGAGTGAPADALEAHVDHARIRELVEVERRDGSRDVERAGGIVARHPPRRGDEKSVQVASQRLIQRGDARDPSVEIDAFIHDHILKEIILDARDGRLLLLEYSLLERLTS